MKHIKNLIITLSLLFSLLSCTDSNDSAGKQAKEPVDTSIHKTIIVDVRTTGEWIDDGHANCTVNYPLDELSSRIESLKQYEKVIVVCRSGHRAGIAKEQLEKAGIQHVENGGAWQNITCR